MVFANVFKTESLNAGMSLSMSEKPVTAEKEDDKSGNHHFDMTNIQIQIFKVHIYAHKTVCASR